MGPFRLRVTGLDNIEAPEVKNADTASAKDPNQKVTDIHVRIGLYHGGTELPPSKSHGGLGIRLPAIETEKLPLARAVAWSSRWRVSPCYSMRALPVGCRMGAMVFGTTQTGEVLSLIHI